MSKRATNRPNDASLVRRGFATRLAGARVVAGYESMAAFAVALGIEGETYRRYERGETEPPLFVLARMADLTHTTVDFLVRGKTGTRLEFPQKSAISTT